MVKRKPITAAIMIMLYLALMIIIVETQGCATNPEVKVVDQTGTQLPLPHYFIRTINGDLNITYWYEAVYEIKDLDGTKIVQKVYLDKHKFFEMDRRKYTGLKMEVVVYNPDLIKYTLVERGMLITSKNQEVRFGGVVGQSKMGHRVFVFKLPTDYQIKRAEYNVDVFDDKYNLLSVIGPFNYK